MCKRRKDARLPGFYRLAADSGQGVVIANIKEQVHNVEPKQLALEVAAAALEKQAGALEIIDVQGKVSYADFIVICSAKSPRQVEALVNNVERTLRDKKVHLLGIEGRQSANWVLLDFGDVIFHVFDEHSRGFYDLDGLWIDADRVPVGSNP